ncbi:hypothetical protein K7H21_28205 (plasmid) [Klebsiella sp. CTHL.F3a]|uniref:hypothetical protein n=1 Tax=Klebsiella sp. CTHL.F3a TaxID=2873296 RepID=UPI001CA78856|nr:hypothetical protein [Klebsiella sp. CTHL.F3a]QZY83019.1 hypothetical protein K7H21_28205 [Klebsiella sp. CTHL.F3a]
MPKTLNIVFDYLTTQYGHQHLWLKLEARTSCLENYRYPIDFYVVSSTGHELAEFDGTKWYYINPCLLTFNVAIHGIPPSTAGHIHLNALTIEGFMQTFGI